MKIILKSNREYEVARAEQYPDGLHVIEDDGSLFVIINPSAIKAVEGGEIVVVEQPEIEPTTDDVLDALLGVSE